MVDDSAQLAWAENKTLPATWFDRHFLLQQQTKHEKFLASFPSINAFSAQLLLKDMVPPDSLLLADKNGGTVQMANLLRHFIRAALWCGPAGLRELLSVESLWFCSSLPPRRPGLVCCTAWRRTWGALWSLRSSAEWAVLRCQATCIRTSNSSCATTAHR